MADGINIHINGLAEMRAGLSAPPIERELRAAHQDVGEEIVRIARQKAGGVGGAAPLTAGTLNAETTWHEAKVTASAPYALGSEHGASGANPSTRQFSHKPGGNREDGWWFGPALDDPRILERFDEALEDVTRPAFPQ